MNLQNDDLPMPRIMRNEYEIDFLWMGWRIFLYRCTPKEEVEMEEIFLCGE